MGLESLLSMAGGASPIGMGLSLAPQVAKMFTSIAQKRKANAITPIDPGFQMNTGIVDNKRIMDSTYNNYTLPGKAGIINNMQTNFAGAMGAATNAATSGGDLLDSITQMTANQNSAISDLGIKEATAKTGMLGDVMNANAAAGNELVLKNQFDNQRYQEKVAEKAALNQASAQNGFSALDGVSQVGGSLLNYKTQQFKPKVGKIDIQGSSFG